MSELNINFSDYKASGVYYLEVDNSISTATQQGALRLAVGFNGRAPFNRPVYIGSTLDCDEFLGPIDRKLERKGCYTNRAIRTMITKAPVYALNLLPVDTTTSVDTNKDVTGVCKLDMCPSAEPIKARKLKYCDMYDRSKFWVADETSMMFNLEGSAALNKVDGNTEMDVYGNGVKTDSVSKANKFANCALFAIGNCGTSDMSIIIRKAENLTGYNVTFLDWYGKEDDIPYSWINPYDYVSDYFVQVIAVKGNLTGYAGYAADPVWREYFDENGLKKDKVNKFLRLDTVEILGNWTGCIIPDFYDKQGRCRSIDYLINKVANKSGVLFGVNTTALETLSMDRTAESGKAKYFMDLNGDNTYDESEESLSAVDLAGHTVDSVGGTLNFLSYTDINLSEDAKTVAKLDATVQKNTFFIESAAAVDGFMPQVGDYVKCVDGTFTKIVKKSYKPAVLPTNDLNDVATPVGAGYEFSTLKNVYVEPVTPDASTDASTDPGTEVRAEDYPDFITYGDTFVTNDIVTENSGKITVRKAITDAYQHLGFTYLPGLKLTNRHLPGYSKADADGVVTADVEAGVSKIYEMLEDKGIRRGLLNDEMLDFRYIVDTMGGGLAIEGGAKRILSELANEKEHCLALINLPAISDFAKYVQGEPCYYDIENNAPTTFNIEHITTEGNPEAEITSTREAFSLPTYEQGSDHTAYFAPYLRYALGTSEILVPPAADVSNTLMNKFLGGDPYKTVANLNGILVNSNIRGLEVDFDETDRGFLEPFGVNPIINYRGTTMIFGDRTAYQTVNSDLNYLHVRELLNTINIRSREILHDYVFGYNIATTRSEIYNRLTPMLKAMQDSGALLKYEIQVDDVNNTAEVIDEKFCIVDIGVWVSPNMEKIITRVTLNRSTTA